MNRATGMSRRGWLATLLALPGLAGCGHFWEDVTSRSPEPGVWNNIQYRWELAFNRPDPLQVLASSTDGDMRRRALETLDVNGSWWDRTQDAYLMFRVLSTSALQERDTICRTLAVQRLGELKDDRVPAVLAEVYASPLNQDPQFPAVKVAVLQSLGRQANPASLDLLQAALAPDNHPDLRHAAAASLGSIKSEQAASALVKVLREDKDVALKHRAYLSLREMTGKDLPAKPDVWEEEFRSAAAAGKSPYAPPNPIVKLASFWGD